jgi:hypothetical protein
MNAVVEQPKAKIILPPARILACTAEEYHKDPCDKPSLSSSTAQVIVTKSPLHAWTRHPKYGQQDGDSEELEAEDEDTKAKSNGTLVHRLLLGKGAKLVVVEADNFKTKAAREKRDEAKSAGKIPVIARRLDELNAIVEILRARCADHGYEFNGDSEIPVEWYERGLQGPVLCRSMIDHAYLDDGVAFDVKTIRNASPDHIARTFVEHGYHIQDHAYTRAQEELRPKLKGRIDLTFLFMEIEPPYAVVPVVPDGAIQEIGKQHWLRAVHLWEQCLAKNEWPSYCSSRITIEAPPWVISRHLGQEWAE